MTSKTNRNPIKQWSITFPKSGIVTREEFVKSFPPHDEVICSMEEHEDGSPHLHLAIKLKKGLSKCGMLKWIQAKWKNDYKRIDIEPTRSLKQWKDYIMKEDPEAYEWNCKEEMASDVMLIKIEKSRKIVEENKKRLEEELKVYAKELGAEKEKEQRAIKDDLREVKMRREYGMRFIDGEWVIPEPLSELYYDLEDQCMVYTE